MAKAKPASESRTTADMSTRRSIAGAAFVSALADALADARGVDRPPNQDAESLAEFVRAGWAQVLPDTAPTGKTVARWFQATGLLPKSGFAALMDAIRSKVTPALRTALDDRYREARAAVTPLRRRGGEQPLVVREVTAFQSDDVEAHLWDCRKQTLERRQKWHPLSLPVSVQRHGAGKGDIGRTPDGTRTIIELLRRHRKAAVLRVLIRGPRGTGKAHITFTLRDALLDAVRRTADRFDSPYPFPLFVRWPEFINDASKVLSDLRPNEEPGPKWARLVFEHAKPKITAASNQLSLLHSASVVVILDGVGNRSPRAVDCPAEVLDFLSSIRRLVVAESIDPEREVGPDALVRRLAEVSGRSDESGIGRYAFSLVPLPLDARSAAEQCRHLLARAHPDVEIRYPRLGEELTVMANPGVVGRVLAGIIRGTIGADDFGDDTLLLAALYMDDLRRRMAETVLDLLDDQEKLAYCVRREYWPIVARMIANDRQSETVDRSWLTNESDHRWLFDDKLPAAWDYLQALFPAPTRSSWGTPKGVPSYPPLLTTIGAQAARRLVDADPLTSAPKTQAQPGRQLGEALIKWMNGKICKAVKKPKTFTWEVARQHWKAYTTATQLLKNQLSSARSDTGREVQYALEQVFDACREQEDDKAASFRVHAAQAAARFLPSVRLIQAVEDEVTQLQNRDAQRGSTVGSLQRLLFLAEVTRHHTVSREEVEGSGKFSPARQQKLSKWLALAVAQTFRLTSESGRDPATALSCAHARYHLIEALSLVCDRLTRRDHFSRLYAEVLKWRSEPGRRAIPTAVDEAICVGTLVQDRASLPSGVKSPAPREALELIRRAFEELRTVEVWEPLYHTRPDELPFGISSHLFVVLRYLTPLLPAHRRQHIIDNQFIRYLSDADPPVFATDTVRVRWLLDWILPELRAGIIPTDPDALVLYYSLGDQLKTEWQRIKDSGTPVVETDELNHRDYQRVLACLPPRPRKTGGR